MSTESTNDEKDYEVGYGKPPRGGQFKKGQSGNPRGGSHAARARKAKSESTFGDIFSKGMQETIEGEENGKKVLRTRLHVGIRTRVKAAAKGDLKALKELLELREAKNLGPLEPEKILVLTIDEARAVSAVGVSKEDCIRRTEEARERWRQRIANRPHPKRVRQTRPAPPARSAKELIDLELERQIAVTHDATGVTERMTVREAIAKQVMLAFMAGKRGASELIIQLNKMNGASQDLVLTPWEAYDREEWSEGTDNQGGR